MNTLKANVLVCPALTLGIVLVVHGAGGLHLEKVGTPQVYFSHNGKPLLLFGGLSDFIFYAAKDAYDYKLWADWAADHGMNHIRAYPPLSWRHIEAFARENGGSQESILYPYEETAQGSRKFDLTKFNTAYWKRFRAQCAYLQKRGIIIHLLMFNGWQFRDNDRDWCGHFFNPANNVNACTTHLAADRLRFYHSVSDGHSELVALQQAWLTQLVKMTADLDNVYYDLVHEIAEHHHRDQWKSKIQPWIEHMAGHVRTEYRRIRPIARPILGMDTGGLSEQGRWWIFTRPYFDVLIYGKAHKVQNAREWRMKYKKPYVPQESWDENWAKYGYREPIFRIRTRKYMWKFMMAKCQQMDLYIKPREGVTGPKGYPHNYDPRGWNPFEKDASILRSFWNSLTDYPNLWFEGRVIEGPGEHHMVLSSPCEAVIYLSSATASEGVTFQPGGLTVKELVLKDGSYKLDMIKPDKGSLGAQMVAIKGGRLSIKLPAFTDDLTVHIHLRDSR